MANHITITDNEGQQYSLSLSLSCYAVLQTLVIHKYNPDFSLHRDIENIDKNLEVVYDNCEKFEEMMMLLFLNTESKFEKGDIKHFDKAIEKYPDDINQTPKKALIAFRDLLKDKHPLETKYSHTTSVMSVHKK